MLARRAKGEASVGELLELVPAERRIVAERSIVWFAKYGVARITKPA